MSCGHRFGAAEALENFSAGREETVENREKKQRWFYAVCVVLMLGTNIIFNGGPAQIIMLLFAGLNISLARKEHRIQGFFKNRIWEDGDYRGTI